MGRTVPVLVCLGLVMGGCTRKPQVQPSPQHVRGGLVKTPAPPLPSTPPASTPSRPILESQQEKWQRLVRMSTESVVHVRADINDPTPSDRPDHPTHTTPLCSEGTGVVVGADGLVLTTGHVVRDAANIKVVFQDGSWAPATRVVFDQRFDLAVLRINVPGLDTLTPTPGPVMIGTPVVALGCVGPGVVAKARAGIITSPSFSLQDGLDSTGLHDYGNLIESTSALEAGFSGGPLLDRRGRLLGLSVAVLESGDVRRGYAIPFSEEVREALARLCAEAAAP